MDEEKQIEEMAQDICLVRTCPTKRNGGSCYKKCKAHIYAERAIEAGYRKQSEAKREVAREIFGEIEYNFESLRKVEYANPVAGVIFNLLDYLKKKYTEGANDELQG